jgi:hypothetical protein
MSFDFLYNDINEGKTKSAGASKERGGKVTAGSNIFYDFYNNHFDAHELFSTPPSRSEFNENGNFKVAEKIFNEDELTRLSQNSDWFGEGTQVDQLINGYTKFAIPQLLNDTINTLEVEIPNQLFAGIEKPKMKINDRFGMFSYDLASMAMTYVYEYFDKQNKKVDANYVVKRDGKFYDSISKKEVEQKIKRRENGTPVVISSVRNSLIDFEKKEKNERAVEIFITLSFSWKEKSSRVIYNAMAGIVVAKNLIDKGFKVKITALLVNLEGGKYYFHMVPVKRYNQPLDINAAAYVCGDPRFYRYQGFKMFIYGFDQNSFVTDSGLGSVIRDLKFISTQIENDYVPNSNLQQANTRLFFGGSRSVNDTKNEVQKALEILNEKYSNDD